MTDAGFQSPDESGAVPPDHDSAEGVVSGAASSAEGVASGAASSAVAGETSADSQRRYPTRVVTMVFTDIVGSTRLKQERGDTAAVDLMAEHDEIVRRLLKEYPDAAEVKHVGDSFFIVFERPSDAVAFSLRAQSAMRAEFGSAGVPPVDRSGTSGRHLEIRIGIHQGEVRVKEGGGGPHARDYFGLEVDTAARVQSVAEGG
ncbi:MAG: adenylate/guanylate cyclase domain-containing protein, partial [Planctomycetes bacterium]|nr:adenylate/guanylate cyclase domain-containing protein [Planctomycetota bacterium]